MTGDPPAPLFAFTSFPVPDSWDYRCGELAHDGRCLVPARPVTARQAVKAAAREALYQLGVTSPPGEWTGADVDLALDVSLALTDLVRAAAAIREKREAGNSLWPRSQD